MRPFAFSGLSLDHTRLFTLYRANPRNSDYWQPSAHILDRLLLQHFKLKPLEFLAINNRIINFYSIEDRRVHLKKKKVLVQDRPVGHNIFIINAPFFHVCREHSKHSPLRTECT